MNKQKIPQIIIAENRTMLAQTLAEALASRKIHTVYTAVNGQEVVAYLVPLRKHIEIETVSFGDLSIFF